MNFRFPRLLMILLLFRALWGTLRGDESPEEGLNRWKSVVRAQFPEVTQLSAPDLAAWQADTNRPQPILLDVRTPSEFRVSRLAGARQVDPDASAAQVRKQVGTNDVPLVVYCSVGWRSSAMAKRLSQAGLTNVVNLEGSIFGWANEDRPLECDSGSTHRVHPYNQTFGKLLKPGRRADP